EYYEVYYLVSGERRYFIHDETYHVASGNIVFIPPNWLHRTMDAGSPKYERILIQFSEAILKRWAPDFTELLYPFHQRMKVLPIPLKDQQVIEPFLYQLLK